MNLLIIAILVFLINLPFGYLKTDKKRLSFWWFLYIHAPVPFLLFIRNYFDEEFSLQYLLITMVPYILGQLIGEKIKRYTSKKGETN